MILLSSCGGNGNKGDTLPVGLKGKYKNDVSMSVYYRRQVSTDGRYLYVSTYPLNQLTQFGCIDDLSPEDIARGDRAFNYKYEQSLTLSKDYTYHYVYKIIFGNPGNCPDMMSINVDIYGTYLYTKTSETSYAINLSSPMSGTESYYGCNFSVNELFWFGGGITAKHQDPDKVIDFALLKEVNREEVDWYVRSRSVSITIDPESAANNRVTDDLFNSYFLDHVGQFCTY